MRGLSRDDVIRMARKVGFGSNSLGVTFTSGYLDDHLERFAKLVAAAEREACAKVCENIYEGDEGCGDWPTPEMCAEAIRARGSVNER